MDNVQNCDSYINTPSSQICRSYLKRCVFLAVAEIALSRFGSDVV
jgi:hypothetical protein